jgi:capsular polysaccharide biosynthesis protein
MASRDDGTSTAGVVEPDHRLKMHLLFSPPSVDDLIRLLKAWRFWSVGALIGAMIGAAVYYMAPPPYRARATVLVDFNLEQAWPQETDRQQFYYLERETRKLEEIARSDVVMDAIVETNRNVTTQELRNGKLSLSQPAEGGWHFYADDENPERAAALASTWSQVFVEQVQSQIGTADGPNAFIEATQTQIAQLPRDRSISISTYLFVGAIVFLAVASFFVLFFPSTRLSPIAAERSGTSRHEVEAGGG